MVTDKMLELERLVGPPIKDEVEPWTRGVEPPTSQSDMGWFAVRDRPYQALGVPVLEFDDPLTILREQMTVTEAALPDVEDLPPPPRPIAGIPLSQRNAGKHLLQQAKLSGDAVRRCKAGGWFYDTLDMQGLQPPQAADTAPGGVEAAKKRLAEYNAREAAKSVPQGSPSPRRPRQKKPAKMSDAQVMWKLELEAAAAAEARRLATPRGNIAGRRFHTFVKRDRAAPPPSSPGAGGASRPSTSAGRPSTSAGRPGTSGGRPGTSGSMMGVKGQSGGAGASRPGTASSALDTVNLKEWMKLFASEEGAEEAGVERLQVDGGDDGGDGRGVYFAEDGSTHGGEEEEGAWGETYVAGTANTAAVAAARAIRTPVGRDRSGRLPSGRSCMGQSRPGTSGGAARSGTRGSSARSLASSRPHTSNSARGSQAHISSFGRKPPSPLPPASPRDRPMSSTSKVSTWTETMFGKTIRSVKPPEDKADKVAMANFAFLSSKHKMDAGLNETLERLTKDRARAYELKSSALRDTAAQFRFPSDLTREIPSARTHAEMLATRAAIERIESYSWYKKMYAHVASQMKHDGKLSHGEQHIVTNITQILVDGHRLTKDDFQRILAGLDLEDHFNMDVQMLIRLLVDNLGVTRGEYEAWHEHVGRASKKEIMRYFDKGCKETQVALSAMNAMRFVAKMKKGAAGNEDAKEKREMELMAARDKVNSMHMQAALIRRNSISHGSPGARSARQSMVSPNRLSTPRQSQRKSTVGRTSTVNTPAVGDSSLTGK